MKPERRLPPPQGSDPASQRDRWLLSYADFLTLLLALFVVLYASALVDVEKNRGLFEGLQSAFAKGTPASEENDPGRVPDAAGDLAPLRQLESNLAKRIDRERARIEADPGVSLHPTERGLVISLAAAEYFSPGSAEIRASRRPVLAAMAPLLAAESAPLLFEGHTDDLPANSQSYPSNWELSSARAAAIARYFIDKHGIDPHRVATTGYAAYRPLSDGESPSERARNRRVEIVVLSETESARPRNKVDRERELGRLLEKLPPLAAEPDEAFRTQTPEPAPHDMALP